MIEYLKRHGKAVAGTLTAIAAVALLTGALVSPVSTSTCSSGQFFNQLSSAGNFSCGTPTGSGGGTTGLFSQVVSATPTSTSTGLTTWLNQGGASVADGSTGVVLTAPTNSGDSKRCRTKTAPSTPYTITALIFPTIEGNFVQVGIGWYDGTAKLHLNDLVWNNGWAENVAKWASTTSFSANDSGSSAGVFSIGLPWLQIRDDGTNVSFSWGTGGSNGNNSDMLQQFSVAKSSGYLGSSGYSKIAFCLNNNNTGKNALAILGSYVEGN